MQHNDRLLGDTWQWDEMRSVPRVIPPARFAELIESLCLELSSSLRRA